MKLKNINIRNLLAIKQAEIETDKPIVFISGNNEAGKSSIADAVSMALSGELCRRVSLKKEAAWLINGDEEGMAEVNVGDHYFFYRITKKGTIKCQGIDPMPALPYVLDTAKFAEVTADERRKLLFDISKCKPTMEDIARRLVERGVDAQMFEAIKPMLRAGFPAAMDAAKDKVKEERASWKTTTGEVYGDKKAIDWKAKAEGNLEEIQNLVIDKVNQSAAVEAELEQENQKLGAMKSDKENISKKSQKLSELREEADKIDRIKRKLEIDRREVDSWESMVERTKLAAFGVGADDTVCTCPECGSMSVFVGNEKKLVAYHDQQGDEASAANLPQYEKNLEIFINSVKNGERDLANAEAAKAQLAMLEDETPPVDDQAIIALTAKIEELKAQRKSLKETIDQLCAQEKALREADQTTANALKHHNQAVAWEKIAAALAPDGIPGELLQDAIKPFNERLANQAEKAGWKVPVIDGDMNISVLGLPYALLSKSAQWRVDCLITEAISHISGLKFMVIDEMSILEPTGTSRGYFFSWLSELAILGEVDTVLVMGALAEEKAGIVADVFENISVHWMADGVLGSIKDAISAAIEAKKAKVQEVAA